MMADMLFFLFFLADILFVCLFPLREVSYGWTSWKSLFCTIDLFSPPAVGTSGIGSTSRVHGEKKSFGCCVAQALCSFQCLRAMGDAPAAMRDSSRCRTEEKRQGKCERDMRKTDTGREKRERLISLSPCLSFPSSLIFACVVPVLAVGWDLEAQMSVWSACLERQEVRSQRRQNIISHY